MSDKLEEMRKAIREKDEELPGEWTVGIGEGISDEQYTEWYYHENWELQVFSDPNQPHTVALYEVNHDVEYEDQRVSEYPTDTNSFDHYRDALQYAYGLMEDYQ